jgi:hypothetical protein
MQAIANTASFHFGYIEQGGASLYSSMALKVRDLEVMRIVVSIGGVETDHFSLWHDKLGNAVAQPLAGVTDPETGVTFPDLNSPVTELSQTNKILPEPADFIRSGLPEVSVIRPTLTENAGAVATIKSFTTVSSKANQGNSSPRSWLWLKQLMPRGVASNTATPRAVGPQAMRSGASPGRLAPSSWPPQPSRTFALTTHGCRSL